MKIKNEEGQFYCTKCGQKGIPIQRKSGQFRAGGHLKKLYCLNCKTETNHCEVRTSSYTYEDFKKEFEMGRFTEDGQRIEIKDLFMCSKRTCQYNYNGRCWNANDSAKCPHKPRKEKD